MCDVITLKLSFCLINWFNLKLPDNYYGELKRDHMECKKFVKYKVDIRHPRVVFTIIRHQHFEYYIKFFRINPSSETLFCTIRLQQFFLIILVFAEWGKYL